MEAATRFGIRNWLAAFGCAVVALLCDLTRSQGGSGRTSARRSPTSPTPCPTSTTRASSTSPTATGRSTSRRARTSSGSNRRSTIGNKLWPQEDGYITRFDPELIYADGTVPAGRRPASAPRRLGGQRRPAVRGRGGEDGPAAPTGVRLAEPSRRHLDPQRHAARPRRPARPRSTSSGGSTSSPTAHPAAGLDKPCTPSGWTSPGTRASIRSSTRCASDGQNGRYTFPDQAPAADLHPCGSSGRAPDSHGCLGAAQSWTPNHDVTLIATAGHLHPGGLNMQLRDTRNGDDQHALHVRRPLLRAGGRGLVGRRDGRHAAGPGGCRCRPATR